jgi:hypothetical protein
VAQIIPGRVRLAELWYRLARDKGGAPLYRQRPAPFYPAQVSQGDMGEAQVSPDGRTPQSLRDLSGGGGLAQQPIDQKATFDRYDRAGDQEGEGVDPTLTPDGPTILSARQILAAPAGQSPDGDLSGGIWKAPYVQPTFTAGRYVYTFDGAAVQQIGDLGSGLQATGNIVSFLSAGGASGVVYWYCPVGYEAPLRYSTNQGGNWAPIITTGDVTNVQSLVEADGEIVCALRSPRRGDAMIGIFDDGGTTPHLFGVVDPIGDAGNPISRLIVHRGRVLVIKDREGVFLLTDDRRSMEEDLFAELRGVRIFAQGACVWRGILWLPTEWGLYAISPNLTLSKVGPEETEAGYVGGIAPRGPVTACDGDAHNLYAFRESYTGPSWLYKANVEVSGSGVENIAWFPWSQQADRARCYTLATCTTRPTGQPPEQSRPHVLLGRTLPAGSQTPPIATTQYGFQWYGLPMRGRDPRTDVQYRYAPAGTLYHSRLTGRFPAIDKAWYGLTPLCAPLDHKLDGATPTTAQSIRVLWKRDTQPVVPPALGVIAGGYTLGRVQTSGVGARESFTEFARGFDTGIRLATTDATTSPQVYSVTVEYDLRPLAVWRHELTLDLSSGAYGTDGSQGFGDPLPPGVALLALRSLAGAAVQMTLIDLWDNEYEVSVPVEGIALRAANAEEAGYGGEVPLLVDVVCTEQFVREPGTWRTVALMTWRRVRDYTWRQLQTVG